MNNSLLFIPDISGFTEFVGRTEINHSQHIIAELLEAIIAGNTLDMEISEIEGDAVLFYKQDSVPPLESIVQQSKTMFLNFHNKLSEYEHRRICNCGACTSATNLSLKFIVHAGDLTFITVANHTKLHGPAVILAHKLLKNNVDSNEYLLFTDKLLLEDDTTSKSRELTSSIENGVSTYQDLGDIEYKYILLENWKKDIDKPEPLSKGVKMNNPVQKDIVIDKPVEEVFEIISNLSLRMEWNDNAVDIKFEDGKINQQGTKHVCVFPKRELHIETITADFGPNKLVYGETVKDVPVVKELSTYFILEASGESTRVDIEMHYISGKGFRKVLIPLMRSNMSSSLKKTLLSLKNYCEGKSSLNGDAKSQTVVSN